MSKLAVIVTLYGQRSIDNIGRVAKALRASTRIPDELWLLYEGEEGWDAAANLADHIVGWCSPHAAFPTGWNYPTMAEVKTPRNEDGTYAEIPYSRKINYALDHTEADYIAYLTDDSWPAPEKYERMVAALDENPEWGAVYCSQDYGGVLRVADLLMSDAHCRVDHTQVMHRRTEDRWPTDIADITVGDANFWRRLHASIGAFYPINEVLDYVRQTSTGISAGQRS